MNGKTAVVTGGASGIGKATAALLVREGARVAVLDRAGAVEDSGALFVHCDVAGEESVRLAFDEVAARFGEIHALFNIAGVAVRKTVEDESAEEWDRCLGVNLKGVFLCAKHALRHMRAGAAIVNMASVTGITGVRNRAAYSASKGAIVALTRNMALDLAPRRVRVNCVCPGFVRTALTSGLLADAGRAARVTAMHPLGRLGEPEDVARAAVFLASPDADWITGQALAVDGGFSAGHSADI